MPLTVFAAVPPIAGGEARYVEKPVPLTVLDAASVVNAPVFGAVDPIGFGDACMATKPVPLTVLDAERVVNDPAAATVPPIAGGEARYVLSAVPATVPLNVCVPLKVFELSVRAIEADVDGNVIVVPSAPASVIEFVAASVFVPRVSVPVPLVIVLPL